MCGIGLGFLKSFSNYYPLDYYLSDYLRQRLLLYCLFQMNLYQTSKSYIFGTVYLIKYHMLK